jgi:hypothetical protein
MRPIKYIDPIIARIDCPDPFLAYNDVYWLRQNLPHPPDLSLRLSPVINMIPGYAPLIHLSSGTFLSGQPVEYIVPDTSNTIVFIAPIPLANDHRDEFRLVMIHRGAV